MKYSHYLEQRHYHGSGVIRCRMLTPTEAEALHYEHEYRHEDEDGSGKRYTTDVDGFNSEAEAREYVRSMHVAILLEGEDLKKWDDSPDELGAFSVTLIGRERDLLLTALDGLARAEDGKELAPQCRALEARLREASAPKEKNQ